MKFKHENENWRQNFSLVTDYNKSKTALKFNPLVNFISIFQTSSKERKV